jgi:hypothetical protein
LEKTLHKKRLVKWLTVKVLSSSLTTKKKNKKTLAGCWCVILAIPEVEIRDQRRISEVNPGQITLKTLFHKYPTQKRASGVAQAMDQEVLSSNPSTTKTTTNKYLS